MGGPARIETGTKTLQVGGGSSGHHEVIRAAVCATAIANNGLQRSPGRGSFARHRLSASQRMTPIIRSHKHLSPGNAGEHRILDAIHLTRSLNTTKVGIGGPENV